MNNFFNTSLNWKSGTILTILFLALLSSCKSDNSEILEVNDLRCEYRINPLGIDNTAPRLSWKLVDQHQKEDKNNQRFKYLLRVV